jgi:hypothetical protein
MGSDKSGRDAFAEPSPKVQLLIEIIKYRERPLHNGGGVVQGGV